MGSAVRSPPADGDASAETSSPAGHAVRRQLERILASREFQVSERNKAFLRFVCEETLAGRGERIKAFAIAIEVFGRDASFDAQNDPVVRLEAGRLRRALERYYLVAGTADPIAIDMPKGSYVPVFTWRGQTIATAPPGTGTDAAAVPDGTTANQTSDGRWWVAGVALVAVLTLMITAARSLLPEWRADGADPALAPRPAAAPARPSVIVLAFTDMGSDSGQSLLSRGFAEELLAQLVRFKEITLYGRQTGFAYASGTDARDLERELGVTYVVEGGIAVAGEELRVVPRLLDARSGAVIWAETYERRLDADEISELQHEVAGEIATRIAQPYGIVARAAARDTEAARPKDMAAYRCALEFYAYRADFSPEGHARVADCLAKTVALYPAYATGRAMLAYVHIDQDRFGFDTPKTGHPPLDLALEEAQRAVSLDPLDVRAWQALMMVHFLRSEIADGIAAGERALELNPNDTELLGEFGLRLALMGEWHRGSTMVRRALERDPANSPAYRVVFALDAFRQGRDGEALREIERASQSRLPIVHGVRAAVLGALGRTEEAAEAGRRFVTGMPGVLERLDVEFAKRNFEPELRARLLDGWRKAGLPVPASGDRPTRTEALR